MRSAKPIEHSPFAKSCRWEVQAKEHEAQRIAVVHCVVFARSNPPTAAVRSGAEGLILTASKAVMTAASPA